MNVHRGVEHGENITIRGTMAPTKENGGEGVAECKGGAIPM